MQHAWKADICIESLVEKHYKILLGRLSLIYKDNIKMNLNGVGE